MNLQRILQALLICIFSLAAVVPALAQGSGSGPFFKRFTAPQVVSGGGLSSDIVLLNTASTACDFGLVVHTGAGQTAPDVSIGGQTGGVLLGTIPAFSSRTFVDDSPQSFLGAASIDLLSPGCFNAFTAQLQFRLRNQSGLLTELFSYPSPEPLKSGRCAEAAINPDVDPLDGDTNIPGFAAVSLNPVDNGEICHSLRDNQGNPAGQEVCAPTDGSHQAQNIQEVFGNLFPGGSLSTWRVCFQGQSQGQPARLTPLFIDVVQEGQAVQFDSNDHQVQSRDCVPDDQTLCLNGGRFQVQVDFQNTPTGPRQQAQVAAIGEDDSGFFFFLDPANTELLVKVLDGCPVNNHFWVFYGSLSNVEYEITVTDTQVNDTRTFINPLGQASPAITDTQAFATCP